MDGNTIPKNPLRKAILYRVAPGFAVFATYRRDSGAALLIRARRGYPTCCHLVFHHAASKSPAAQMREHDEKHIMSWSHGVGP